MNEPNLPNSISRQLMKLARVEIQAIMQFLTFVELIRFSRCSRTLLADGDMDTAWRTQLNNSLLLTPTTATFLPDDPTLLRHSSIFWRHQPRFSLIFENDSPAIPITISCSFILSILEAVPRIRVVSFPFANFSTEEWATILQHPSLTELDEFHIRATSSSNSLKCITEFPRITTLKAISLPFHYRVSCDDVCALSSLSHLHTITFTDSRTTKVDAAGLPLLNVPASTTIMNQLNQLTNVRIRRFQMDSTEFWSALPQLTHRLQQLHIEHWEPDGVRSLASQLASPTIDALRETFTSLIKLSQLSLIAVAGIDDFLPIIAGLTHLQRLSLGYLGHHSRSPGLEPLRRLLTHSPDLVVDLCIYHILGRPPAYPYVTLLPAFDGRFHLTYQVLCELCEVENCIWECQVCRMGFCHQCDDDVHKPKKFAHHRRIKRPPARSDA